MTDEKLVAPNTWARAAEPIKKMGYMDGASDGQKSTFQSSFDKGYHIGFSFGSKLGKMDAHFSMQNKEKLNEMKLRDPLKLNCCICLDNSTNEDTIVNLYNKQKESNEAYLQNLEKCNK